MVYKIEMEDKKYDKFYNYNLIANYIQLKKFIPCFFFSNVAN
jgi:hypothetical protein